MIVWAVTGDKRTMRFNRFAEKMTGLKEEEVLGKKLAELPELDGGVSLLRDLLNRAVYQDFVNNVELKLPEHSPEARFFQYGPR